MTRRSVLAALLLALLPTAAGAGPSSSLAEDDLALSRLLFRQEREMEAASLAVEEWAAGRLKSAEAKSRAEAARDRGRVLEGEIERRAAQADGALARSARRVAHQRAALVDEAARVLIRGAASRADLLAFGARQGRTATATLRDWLRCRLDLAARMEGQRTAVSFYRWQRQLLPLQLQALALAQRARAVLDGVAMGQAPAAAGLFRQGQDLAGRVAALRVGPGLSAAQAAAAREVQSLSRLLEAVELMAADPSPESSSRVARWSASVRKDSARAEEESLEALERALRS